MLQRINSSVHKKIIRLSLLALSALIQALTMLFPKIGILAWIGLVPLCTVLVGISEDKEMRHRDLYRYGFFFFLVFYAVNFHWFVAMYPLDYIRGMTDAGAVAVVLAGCLGLSSLQSLGAAPLFILFAYLYRGELVRRYRWVAPLVAGGLWAILEWTQTLTWMGVPWARLAISQVSLLPLVQSASLFGASFVAFLMVSVNFYIAFAILFIDKRKIFAALATLIFALNAALGAVLYHVPQTEEKSVKVAAIQGNVTSQKVWDSFVVSNSIDRHIELSRQAAESGASVIVWAETVIPYNIDATVSLKARLSRLASEHKITLLIGAYSENSNGQTMNSIYTFLPDGTISNKIYSKRHMVPFGEYVPYRAILEIIFPPLTKLAPLKNDMVPGNSSQITENDGVRFGSLICFDSIYGELARKSVLDGAEVLAISTNDSWFDGSAALGMHNAHSVLRAVENGRYVIRAANTGISSVITDKGEVLCEVPAGQEGYILETLSSRNSKTLYTCVGDIFVYACILIYVSLAVDKKYNIVKNLLTKSDRNAII